MTADEIEKMKRQIAALGSLEQGGTDISRMTLDQAPDDELPIATPTRRVIVPRAAPPEVPVPTSAPVDPDAELTAARGGDVDAWNDRATETALRQMVAGITRTKAPDSISQLGTGEKDLLGRRRQAQIDALRQLEAGNNADRTAAYRDSTAAGAARADKKLAFDGEEAGRRDARSQAKAALEEAEFAERKRHNKASEGIGWTNAKKEPGGELAKKKFAMKQDALKPRSGWEPIDPDGPVFRSSQDGSRFDGAVAAMGAIRNHRDHVLHELEALKNVSDPRQADEILGRINAQMGALASKLRDAEGLNNTDAANHVIEGMLSMSGGSIVNVKNMLNSNRLPAILNAAIASGEANLDTVAESNNLRRSKGGAAAPGQTPGHSSGKVVVSNGKETMEIDASDEAAAAADGFKRVK